MPIRAIEQQVDHVIVVGRGQGGVERSSLVVKLAQSLRDFRSAVGILDADLAAPDIPAMLGVTRREPATSIDLWRARGRQKAIDGHLQRMLLSQLWTVVTWDGETTNPQSHSRPRRTKNLR